MQSLDESFNELLLRLESSSSKQNTGDDPVYYLVFDPQDMLDAKRKAKEFAAKLKNSSWQVHTFSMADKIHSLFKDNWMRDMWIEAEQEDPTNFEEINATLTDVLTQDDTLKNELQEFIESIDSSKKSILFITDIEALHPYIRIGALEQQLVGKFSVPTVIFYPGRRAGKTTLKFLGIYPEDGNYRSTHIG